MPTESILLSIAVCGVFLGFAIALAVIDQRTARWQRSMLAKRNTAAAESARKKAA